MTQIAQFGVTKIELIYAQTWNQGARTLRVTSKDYNGKEQMLDITLYGETEALDLLPKSPAFIDYANKAEAA